MFKRLFWLMVGTGFGFGASLWVNRFLRQTAERYAPQRVGADMSKAVRSFGHDVRAAVADGRDAMRAYEQELHERVAVSDNGH